MFSRGLRIVAQIALFFFIIASAVYCAFVGPRVMQSIAAVSPVTIPNLDRFTFVGVVAGALVGFLFSSVASAGIIALFEIAENTSEMLRNLRYLSRMAYHNAAAHPQAIAAPPTTQHGVSA